MANGAGSKTIKFFCIVETVLIKILFSIDNTIIVGVGFKWICFQDIYLYTITKPVLIGVPNIGFGLQNQDFVCVRKAIKIQIFIIIFDPVFIRVNFEGVCF